MVPLTDEQIERAALALCELKGQNPDHQCFRRGDGTWTTYLSEAKSQVISADAIFVMLHNARGV